jgi:hypothetical protein
MVDSMGLQIILRPGRLLGWIGLKLSWIVRQIVINDYAHVYLTARLFFCVETFRADLSLL